ncbi:antitoxin [soil metagenome]
MDELRQVAARHGVTVSEGVRQSLRAAQRRESDGDPAGKLARIRVAAGHSFPTADVSEMLAQIEAGYLAESQ